MMMSNIIRLCTRAAWMLSAIAAHGSINFHTYSIASIYCADIVCTYDDAQQTTMMSIR